MIYMLIFSFLSLLFAVESTDTHHTDSKGFWSTTSKEITFSVIIEDLKGQGLLTNGEIGSYNIDNKNIFLTDLINAQVILKKNIKDFKFCSFDLHKEEKIRKKSSDFWLETWVFSSEIEAENTFKNVVELVQEDVLFEKPPKVILYKEKAIYVISTWGAVYRNKLYKYRDLLSKKYDMKRK